MCNRWKRVHGLSRCPICGKPDWCLVAPDRSAAICPRIEEGSSRFIEGSGYLHILKVTDQWMDEEYHPKGGHTQLPEHNEVLAILARKWILESSLGNVEELACKLGVSDDSLRQLNVGWFAGKSAWTFPMLRQGRRLIGVRLRPRNGKKFAVKGSKNGLFVPNNLPDTGVVYVCEGESDTAAMLTCGLPAIGRPSCNSGDRLVLELCKNRPVVVCSDRDGVGRKGAKGLVDLIRVNSGDVTMMTPPERYKDIREWLHGEGKEKVHSASQRVFEEAWG